MPINFDGGINQSFLKPNRCVRIIQYANTRSQLVTEQMAPTLLQIDYTQFACVLVTCHARSHYL
jgi:hypothetical protein